MTAAFPAAFDGDWTTLSDDLTAMLAVRLHDFGAITALQDVEEIRVHRLPFYPDHVLCDVQVKKHFLLSTQWVSCIYSHEGVRPLTGAAEVIHTLNKEVKPDLSDLAVQESYLKFFCRFVFGAEGPFEVVTEPGQVDGAPDAGIGEPHFDLETGLWTASVLYGTALFDARFKVEPGGMVSMEDDVPLAQNVRRVPDVQFDGLVRTLRKVRE